MKMFLVVRRVCVCVCVRADADAGRFGWRRWFDAGARGY